MTPPVSAPAASWLPAGSRSAPRRWVGAGVAVAVLLAAVHVALVSRTYHVGSFDDDGHYLALARALLHGRGYVDTSAPGSPPETLVPPGYPAVLAAVLWLSHGGLWAARALSAASFVACIPVLDRILAGRGTTPVVRVAAALLVAANPTLATFGAMVMPDVPFVLVLLAVVWALPRTRASWFPATLVVLGTPTLLLLKSAGLAMVVGVLVWLALRSRWRQLLAVTASCLLLLGPVVGARIAAGNVLGTRYASEYASGGPLGARLGSGALQYLTDALPGALVSPGGNLLTDAGPVAADIVTFAQYSAVLAVLVGFGVWLLRRLDVTATIVPLYLAETLPYPFINFRRLLLVLPLALGWYCEGVAAGWRWLRRPLAPLGSTAVAGSAVLALGATLAVLFPQNARFNAIGQQSATPRGSDYVAALRRLTPPGWSIATGYRWTISFFSARSADNTVFLALPCPPQLPDATFAATVHRMLQSEHVATVLVADLNLPDTPDSTCLPAVLDAADWAVPAFHGSDSSTVWVLRGPGTPRPIGGPS